MLPRTKLLKTGDFMAGMQYSMFFMLTFMIFNKLDLTKQGFIAGAIVTALMYYLENKTNQGALQHYVLYCFTPTRLEGNTLEKPGGEE